MDFGRPDITPMAIEATATILNLHAADGRPDWAVLLRRLCEYLPSSCLLPRNSVVERNSVPRLWVWSCRQQLVASCGCVSVCMGPAQRLVCSFCPGCPDCFDDHILCCDNAEFTARHEAIVRQLTHFLQAAGMAVKNNVGVGGSAWLTFM